MGHEGVHPLIIKAQTYFWSLVASDRRWPSNTLSRSMMFEMLQACWLANTGR